MTSVDAYLADIGTLWCKWTLICCIFWLPVVQLSAEDAVGDSATASEAKQRSGNLTVLGAGSDMNQEINWDQTGAPLVDRDAPEQMSVVGAMTQMFLGLLFVIGLMVAAAWSYKRWGKKFVQSQSDSRHMEVIETLSLGVKRQLSIVRVADQILVLGSGEHEINNLASMSLASFQAHGMEHEAQQQAEMAEEDEAGVTDKESRPASVQDFKQKLEAVLQNKS